MFNFMCPPIQSCETRIQPKSRHLIRLRNIPGRQIQHAYFLNEELLLTDQKAI